MKQTVLVFATLLFVAVPLSDVLCAEVVTTEIGSGGVTFKSGDNTVTLGAWGQFRWTGDDKEAFDSDATGTKGFDREDGFTNAFNIPRLRIGLQGTFWRSWVSYRFEFEMSSTTGDGGSRIKDGYVQFELDPAAAIRVGQYKTPFSLQELTSDKNQEFVERSLTNAKFAAGRDLGVQIGGTAAKKKLGYAVGLFNGGGESRAQEDRGLMYAGRGFWDPLGEYKLAEGPLDNEDPLILHFGAAYRGGEAARGTATTGVVEDPNDERVSGLETALRWKRLFVTSEFFAMTDEQGNPVSGPDIRSRGWHVQAGVMVLRKNWEIAGRFARIDPDRSSSFNSLSESRLASNWFLKGHNLKFQVDAGRISYGRRYSELSTLAARNMPALGKRLDGAREHTDDQYRAQLQLSF